MEKSIYQVVRDVKHNYEHEKIDTVEGLDFNMYDRIVETEFMVSGRYMSGDYDENGDIKPVYDIITRILENQRSAEEVDTKDMVLKTKDKDYYTRAMLLSGFNQDWMEEKYMDRFHNEAIETRGKHGGLLVKVVESSDDIDLEVVDWTQFMGDAVDLEAGVKVINHYYTPDALIEEGRERGWDEEAVKRAIDLYAETAQEDDYEEQRETTGNYILVREISGNLPREYMDENAEEYEYSYQLHYIAGAEFHSEKDGEQGVTLDSMELEQSPYYYLPYKKRSPSGKTLGIGMVERSRHGQIQSNIAAQQYKYSMDLASTHVLQSASKNLKGKNVITNMKRGTILKYEDGKPISGVDMSPQALGFLDNYMGQWQNQVDRATGTFAVATGEDLPSGTPYRLGAILDQNAQSSFDLRREEYGIFLNRIYKERIIPFFIRQLRKKQKLSIKLTGEEIKKLDQDVAQYKADKEIINLYLKGEFDDVPPVMKFAVMDVRREEMMTDIDRNLKRGKNRRTFTDFPKGYWEGVAANVYIDITGEKSNKGAVLETINNALLQYAQMKPLLEQDKNARDLFNKILVTAGQEPLDFSENIPNGGMPVQQPSRAGQTPLDQPEELAAKPQ